eukprot:TRINITY_DN53_c0_g1_i1.p1 TRINITY_DN53_c0_g1~~TRINITY_DN53_c0_g1_i1.p1  ORF type:complete len:376 (+),score=78.93 TRINITY_DN53_c0_g1_i1:120-1247(+)
MADKSLTAEQKFEIITRDLQEYVGEKELKEKLEKDGSIKVYWGTAITGKPHLGYFVPMYKIADFLSAGCEVTILFADLHGFLDNLKSSWEELHKRCHWYEFIIKEMLKRIGVPLDKLKFVRGSDYQLSQQYSLDVYKVSTKVTTEHCLKAGAEVVRQVDHPLLSNLLYPILQALDEEYLKVDAQFGGVDQRKIFMFARDHLPALGYQKRIHLMNPLIPGLGKSGKMSSSEPLSKVDFDDGEKVIRSKFNSAYSEDGVAEGNGILAILRYILFRFIQSEGRQLVVERPDKYGGTVTFNTYEEVVSKFVSKDDFPLSSIDLKKAVANEVIKFLAPITKAISENLTLLQAAYPEEKPQEKKPAPKKKGGKKKGPPAKK